MKKFVAYAPYFVIAAGVVLRVKEYLDNRSLWVDEAFIALNIIHKSYSGLMGHLDYLQHAPISFLWVEKFMTGIAGTGEYSLRFFPLISGVIALILFYRLVTYLLPRPAAYIALVIFACSDVLIHYSSEVKQYSWDIVIILVLYILFLPDIGTPIFERRRFRYAAIAGAVIAWIIHPAIFILAGIGAALFFRGMRLKNRTLMYQSAGLLGVWGISFGLFYAVFLRGYFSNTTFLSYWSYVSLLPTTRQDLSMNIGGITSLFQSILGSPSYFIGIAFFIIGGITFWKRKPEVALAFIFPLIFTWVASGLRLYPMADRLWLFLIPSIVICIATGAVAVFHYLRKQQSIYATIFSWICIGALLYSSIFSSVTVLKHPEKLEEVRPVIEYLRLHKEPDDRVYVYYGSIAAFRYYTERLGVPTAKTTIGVMSRGNWQLYEDDLSTLGGQKRVWVVFSHTYVSLGYQYGRIINEEQYMIQYLDSIGKRLDEFYVEGASLYLYDLTSAIR